MTPLQIYIEKSSVSVSHLLVTSRNYRLRMRWQEDTCEFHLVNKLTDFFSISPSICEAEWSKTRAVSVHCTLVCRDLGSIQHTDATNQDVHPLVVGLLVAFIVLSG